MLRAEVSRAEMSCAERRRGSVGAEMSRAEMSCNHKFEFYVILLEALLLLLESLIILNTYKFISSEFIDCADLKNYPLSSQSFCPCIISAITSSYSLNLLPISLYCFFILLGHSFHIFRLLLLHFSSS